MWINRLYKKQGDCDCKVIIRFCTNFKLSVDLTVIISVIGFGIYLTLSLSETICGIVADISKLCIKKEVNYMKTIGVPISVKIKNKTERVKITGRFFSKNVILSTKKML